MRSHIDQGESVMDQESRSRVAPAPEKAFALMKCGQSGDDVVGVFYRVGGSWQLTYSSLTGGGARVGPGEQLHLRGEFSYAAEYLGCASCHAGGYIQCSRCAELSCWDTNPARSRCGWCGSEGSVSGVITQVAAGRD
jgi:hypothetical protein